jgi:hypothetical protein
VVKRATNIDSKYQPKFIFWKELYLYLNERVFFINRVTCRPECSVEGVDKSAVKLRYEFLVKPQNQPNMGRTFGISASLLGLTSRAMMNVGFQGKKPKTKQKKLRGP